MVVRIIADAYRDRPLSLEGSVLYGGRYNPPGEFGALYCGLTTETCWAELEHKHEGRLKRSAFRLVRLSVRLQRVLDLTASTVRDALDLPPEALTRPTDYALTRAIARSAREAGFEAILAPSAAGKGTILAIFTDRLAEGSGVAAKTRSMRSRGRVRTPRRPR
ncbi:MAG: RES family NAD+ phosphorylase [Nitrospirota bacterium]